MLFKSLYLKNIRSYTKEHINFPEGVVLLAGDIGAGKSTILLAIEFALFGILRGELSGTALLRNGSREGIVELTFELNNKSYTIGRVLKRSKTSVEQDAGYIVEDGLRREATAIELKTAVLNLIGYPQDLITKSKSMIYRYTVYTPQEEMKRIILEDKESRLMILRKVFDIDKYKRICDNINIYAKLLREQKRMYEGQLVDEPLKKQQLQQKKQEAIVIQQAIQELMPKLTRVQSTVLNQRKSLDALEQERSAFAQFNSFIQTAEKEITLLLAHKKNAQQELAQITTILATLQVDQLAQQSSPQELAKLLQQKQQEFTRVDEELRTYITAHTEIKITKLLSETTLNKLFALEQCPMCLQKVDIAHKHTIQQQEQQKQQALTAQLSNYETSVCEREQQKQQIQKEITALQQQHTAAQAAQYKIQQLQLYQQRKTQLETQLAQLEQSLIAAEQRRQQATTQLQNNADFEKRFVAAKNALDATLQQEQRLIVENARFLEQEKHVHETIALFEQELALKQKAHEHIAKIYTLHHWLDEFLTNLMIAMEKHVLTKVYHEFNALFQQWFNILIEDETMIARLDEEFLPLVQQNGYDIDVSNLSGGEKTACALAYRLALNKVINELRTNIHTKDLIILDEPTDGFSAAQIDRMRDVLEQVNARQTIIVSHEAAIESIADHVLRVVKEEHASKVIV